MPLQETQIKEILKSPKNRATIQKAIAQQNRIKLHTETVLSRLNSTGATVFLDWVKTLIPSDKYFIFLSLFKFPVLTNELTGKIFEALFKVFEGQNPVFDCNFISTEIENDYTDYKDHKPCFKHLKRDIKQLMQSNINSVVVVDVEAEQRTARPEPYFYFLDVSLMVDYDCDDSGFDWAIFKQEGDRLAVFDDLYYRVFQCKEGTHEIESLISETSHDLGYCPVSWAWSTDLNTQNKGLKKSPLSVQLSALDWLLFYSVSKMHLDLYASYPIYSAYATDCDFENIENGQYCEGGFLKDNEHKYIFQQTGAVMPCPICSKSRLTGAGSFVEVPIPDGETADLRNPVQITTIDRNSLDYNVDETQRLEAKIYQSVTGYGGEMTTNKAVNEKQVIASFESRTTVLNNIKKNIEHLIEWIEKTVCKLRYGSSFLGCNVSLGTEFYLSSASDLLEMYSSAKAGGFSDTVLDMLHDQYVKTKYRHNPEQLKRQKTLSSLDPFKHLSKTEVKDLFTAGQIRYEDYMLKINFSSLIMRFERENTNINKFGSLLSFDAKIKSISDILKGYAKEMQPIREPQIVE